jgi:hypothetical protein
LGLKEIIIYRFGEFTSNIVGDEQFLELRITERFKWAMKDFDQEVKPSFLPFPLAALENDPTNNIIEDCLLLTS